MISQEKNISALRTKEAAPSNRGNWWRCLFDQSEDAQVVCRANGTVFEANKKAVQLLALPETVSEMQKQSFMAHLTSGSAKKVADLLRRPLGRQESLMSISLLVDGRICLLADLQATPLDEGFSLITLKDASRRWRLESHVQRLMSAVDATPDVIFLTDSEFKIAFVNSAFHVATGYTVEDALGKKADFLRSPASVEKMQAYLASVKVGADWMGELVNVRSDGSKYTVDVTISPLYDKEGVFSGYVAFERDTAVRKRLQEELSGERNYIHSILNSLDSAIYTIDRCFRLTHVNDGWKKMPAGNGWLKIPGEPRTGMVLLDMVEDPARKAQIQALFESVLADGKPQELQAASGEGQHWSVRITPWMQDGEVRGLNYIVTDQSRFRELERQLYQAQKMETVGALAAGVAHDFNNLLQVICGNVSLMSLDPALSDSQRRKVQQIEQASERASSITQQLLSFSRVSDEKITAVDFNHVIQEASQLSQRSLMSNVELELAPARRPALVRMDSTRAQQLLLNLCVNALDAMPQGGRLVLGNRLFKLAPEQAAKTQFPPGTDFVCCSVTDTGAGIPAEILKRIFDPFFTTKEKGKGTGLGLSIVHGIVSQVHGFIEVDSETGQGTTFKLCMPCAHAELAADIKPARPTPRPGSGRILVVDDLDLVLELTGTFLRTAGYDVIPAASAEAALDVLQTVTSPIDLVFTDYNMKGMNGGQLIEQVAARNPKMKFIMASGYLGEVERRHFKKNPNVQILDKPFNMRDASEMIAEALAQKREAASTSLTH